MQSVGRLSRLILPVFFTGAFLISGLEGMAQAPDNPPRSRTQVEALRLYFIYGF